MAKDPASTPPPWYWHLYRPEALLGYIAIAFAIYYFVSQPSGPPVAERIWPLPDGNALMVGQQEDGALMLWKTKGLDEDAWRIPLKGNTDLPDNYVAPPQPRQFRPIMASDGLFAYLLTGLQRGKRRQLLSLHQIRLEDGERIWTNTTQPSGEALFEAVHRTQTALFTVHQAGTDTRKLYLTGRSLDDGGMIWKRLFEWNVAEFLRRRQEKALVQNFGQQIGVAQGDTLWLLDPNTGQTIDTILQQSYHYHGAWLFYKNAGEFRGRDMETQKDTLIANLDSSDTAELLAAGFYQGQPAWLDADQGIGKRQGQRLRMERIDPVLDREFFRTLSTASKSAYRSHFGAEEWTRYLPFLGGSDSKKLIWWDFERMEVAFESPVLADSSFQENAFFSYNGQHYWLFKDLEQHLVLIQFDGQAGGLSRAVRSTFSVENALPIRLDQPVGGNFWLGGGPSVFAVAASNLALVYRSQDEMELQNVTDEYVKRLGYAYGD